MSKKNQTAYLIIPRTGQIEFFYADNDESAVKMIDPKKYPMGYMIVNTQTGNKITISF